MTTEEATLEFIKENLAEIRHTEDHRNNITSVILVIVGAILAFVSSKEDLADQIIPFISIFVTFLGALELLLPENCTKDRSGIWGAWNYFTKKLTTWTKR